MSITNASANGNGLILSETDFLQKLQDIERRHNVVLTGDRRILEIFRLALLRAKQRMVETLIGPSGAGKEILGEAIHAVRDGNSDSLWKVNVAALPENLLESELFGHEKGSFTDARQERIGRFDLIRDDAEATVFLDEVGELSPWKQTTLLRPLDDVGMYSRVGNNREWEIIGRRMCATNADLDALVIAGKFRADLRNRLMECVYEVPPIAKRDEEHRVKIFEHRMKQEAYRYGHPDLVLAPNAIDFLLHAPIEREMRGISTLIRQATEYTLLHGDQCDVVTPEVLQHILQVPSVMAVERSDMSDVPSHRMIISVPEPGGGKNVTDAAKNAEFQMIEQVLVGCGWNRTRTAKELDMCRVTLQKKIKRGKKLGFFQDDPPRKNG